MQALLDTSLDQCSEELCNAPADASGSPDLGVCPAGMSKFVCTSSRIQQSNDLTLTCLSFVAFGSAVF